MTHSPGTPFKSSTALGSTPLLSARASPSDLIKGPNKDVNSRHTMIGPTPNRATKPKLQAHSKGRPAVQSTMSESDVSSRKLPAASSDSSRRGIRSRLETDEPTFDDRISPFSTPPSSDDSGDINPNASAALKGISHSPTRALQPIESSFLKASFGEGQYYGRSQLTQGKPPELPPRPDIDSHVSSIPGPNTSLNASNSMSRPREVAIETLSPLSDKAADIQALRKTYVHMPDSTAQLGHASPKPRQVAPHKSISDQKTRAQNIRSPPDILNDLPVVVDRRLHSDSSSVKKADLNGGFLDSSKSSRRPPWAKNSGSHVIHTNYDTKLFDMCAGHACCAGQLMRVWNLSSGKLELSLAIGERDVKATALAFKPGSKSTDEGSRLWIGTNYGDLLEIDIVTHKVIFNKSKAHSGREVVKIHRYQNTMWTLDEEGTLLVWPPSDGGLPTLDTRPTTHKVPRGHITSVVIGGLLWLATGKLVRVFRPSADVSEHIDVEQQPFSQPGVGEITSCAVVESQLDKVYFGHTDGNISMYSTINLACLGILSISVYKINCLVGAGSHLWAGYNTGKICVYDVQSQPWRVIKDYHAHEGPVVSMSVDKSSLWLSGQLRIGSLSLDNTIRLWDGLLEQDWLESELRAQDASWCNFEEIEAAVMTWNAGACTPASLRYGLSGPNMLHLIFSSGRAPDLLVLGFQELVDLEDKRLTAKTLFKGSRKKDSSEQEHMSHQYRDWRDHLIRCVEDFMPKHESYSVLHTASMVGLFSCIFVKSSQRSKISNVHAAEVKRGMGGLHGNKGALIVRFHFSDSSICLINCHLAAGQTQTMHRNNDIAAILESFALPPEHDLQSCYNLFTGGGDGSMILDHEICILNGDLNYRIDTMSRDMVLKAIRSKNLTKLLERDQLLVSRRKNPAFGLKAFEELPIDFDPTYKYDVGSDTYDSSEKHRAPAWCDRILYRGAGKIRQLDYRRHELRISDHRPVSATFRIRTKTTVPAKREKVWQECQQRFQSIRNRLEKEAQIQYLRDVLGLNVEEARGLVQSQAG
ncbi:MAG: hypothetical protein Q9223_002338 [Gallowayella weberi]